MGRDGEIERMEKKSDMVGSGRNAGGSSDVGKRREARSALLVGNNVSPVLFCGNRTGRAFFGTICSPAKIKDFLLACESI